MLRMTMARERRYPEGIAELKISDSLGQDSDRNHLLIQTHRRQMGYHHTLPLLQLD